ncbi:amidohydrolase family protein [Mesorhizobium sp. CAU 1741]|uniref:amidohydrolase family protein n=1 Tax=Mesorhizobium sp. CAU 1741 TaxID=3140366 RepID=UPI00325A7532
MYTIDMHTHTLCPDVEPLVHGKYDPQANPYRRDMSAESRVTDGERKPTYGPMLKDPQRRIADMERMKVNFQVVAPAPAQQHYWADEELLVKLSMVQNDHVAGLVAGHPKHFAGMGTLPMAFPAAAAAEAERAVGELGLRGFQIDTRVNDHELSEPAFDPVWKTLARLGVPLFLHPLGFSHGQRLSPFFMINSVGQPLEELLAAMHLISGGVLDRHPGLKVVIAHGGGYLPFYVGRLDHAWKVRPEVRALTPEPPSAYLKRMWFDTCIFRADHLASLVELVGIERVMLGSDYPFDMGDEDPTAIVMECAALDDAGRDRILSGNARQLFGLA